MQNFYSYFFGFSESIVSEAKKRIENYRIHGPEFVTLRDVFKNNVEYHNVCIDDCKNLKSLSGLPERITGDLTIAGCPSLESLEGLSELHYIGGSLNIGGLKSNEISANDILNHLPYIHGRKINSNHSFLKSILGNYNYGYKNMVPSTDKDRWPSSLIVVPYLGKDKKDYRNKFLGKFIIGNWNPDGVARWKDIADKLLLQEPVLYKNTKEESDLNKKIESFLLTRQDYDIPEKVFNPRKGGRNLFTVAIRVDQKGQFYGYKCQNKNDLETQNGGYDMVVTADRENKTMPIPNLDWIDAVPPERLAKPPMDATLNAPKLPRRRKLK